MEDPGRIIVSRKSGIATILAPGVVALAALGLSAVIVVNADWSQDITQDTGMGLGFGLCMGLPAAAGCFPSARRRFDIRERGLSVRQLFSSLTMPFSHHQPSSSARESSASNPSR
ncbi:MAG: hypothetical protein Q8S33_10995 [Myxococcales bacterium]|nr:hypothetical protein [Myxococcales bacterium]